MRVQKPGGFGSYTEAVGPEDGSSIINIYIYLYK